jgi:hypothetical protein
MKSIFTNSSNPTINTSKVNNIITKNNNKEENVKSYILLQNESNKLKQYIKGMFKQNTLLDDKSNSSKSHNLALNKVKNESILSLKNQLEPSPEVFNIDEIADRSIDSLLKRDIDNSRAIKKIETISDSEISDDIMVNEVSEDYVIDTNSFIYNIWESLLSITLFYIIVVDTYIFSFIDVDEILFTYISMTIDAIYILDFIKCLYVPYFDFEENMIKNRKMIFRHYLQNGFFIDLLTGIPFSILIGVFDTTDTTHLKFIRIAKISRLTRLTKIMKMNKMAKTFKKDTDTFKLKIIDDLNISSNMKRFTKFGLYFLLFSHISSCLWVFVSKFDYPNWISDNNYENEDNVSLYVNSFYFNLVTIFSIGYGDIRSINFYERLFNIVLMIFGVLLYSFTITSLSNIVVKIDKKEKQYNKRVDFLDEIKIKYKLDARLYKILFRFLNYDLQINRINKKMILNELPQRLQYNLIIQIYKKPIKILNFFHDTPSDFKFRAVTLLKQLKMLKGEYLIKTGDFLEEIYFIKKGVMLVEFNIGEKRFTLLKLYSREHFGDIYMCRNIRSPVGLYVKSCIAELYLLEKKDFIALNEEFPEIIENMIKKSLENSTRIELKAKYIIMRYSNDNESLNKSNFDNLQYDLSDVSSKHSRKNFNSNISSKFGSKISSRKSSKCNEDVYDNSFQNLHLINYNSNVNNLQVVEENSSDFDQSKSSSQSSSEKEENVLKSVPQINISYNINIQNNLNFAKNSTFMNDTKQQESNNNDTIITNNFMNRDFNDTMIDKIAPSKVFQNLTDITIEAVKEFDFNKIVQDQKFQEINNEEEGNKKQRISILKGSDSPNNVRKKESKAIFDVDYTSDNFIRSPNQRKKTEGETSQNDLTQEIEKVSRSSLFNNLFTNKSKRRLTRIMSPIDLNEKRSNSLFNISKKKNSFIKKEDNPIRKSSYTPQKKIKKLSESHFTEIMNNLKKDAFVLNNPLGIFSSRQGPTQSVIIQEQLEKITEMFEDFMVSVFRYKFNK